ncbi:MAG: hypothetical protein IME93_03620 [Proteobacteria bacterium]|nr:hypothetical protein [Pseudomonadota bacterium]
MRHPVLLLTLFLITGCAKPVITELDKQLLLTADDLVAIGCKSTKASDLVYESSGLEYLSKEVSVKYNGIEKCGFYLHIEITELKIGAMGGNSERNSLGGAIIGLKFADVETKAPDKLHAGLKGRYLEAYGEDKDYRGFVYASEQGELSILAFVFGIAKKHQPILLDLVKSVEVRNYNKKKTETNKTKKQKS